MLLRERSGRHDRFDQPGLHIIDQPGDNPASRQEGVRAWDTFATLAATAKKLGVSFYCYLHDRISAKKPDPTPG